VLKNMDVYHVITLSSSPPISCPENPAPLLDFSSQHTLRFESSHGARPRATAALYGVIDCQAHDAPYGKGANPNIHDAPSATNADHIPSVVKKVGRWMSDRTAAARVLTSGRRGRHPNPHTIDTSRLFNAQGSHLSLSFEWEIETRVLTTHPLHPGYHRLRVVLGTKIG
jgi:hypothetical protein